jgi:hypothetical protein
MSSVVFIFQLLLQIMQLVSFQGQEMAGGDFKWTLEMPKTFRWYLDKKSHSNMDMFKVMFWESVLHLKSY